MRRRWLHRSVWLLPLLVLGSAVLPAAHRAAHHGADATRSGAHVQADEACALCAATFADEPPTLPGLAPLAPAPAPRAARLSPPAADAPVRATGRAPPAG